jgi:RHS repeat-associated protein
MYDAANRVTTTVEPNGSTVTNVYDAANQLTDTTDQDGRRTTYAYDNDGRQTGETWVGASPSEKITYTYDSVGQMTGAADSYATITIAYDNNGRLGTLVTSGPGTGQPTVTLTYGYDQVGDRTSLTDSLSSQGLISYTYDADGRVTLITTTYGGTAGPQISFGYDNGSRLTSISRQIGSSTTATEVNTTIVYDAANRVGTMTQSQWVYNLMPPGWTVTPLATIVYGYDAAGRTTSEQDKEGTASFTYDNSNELTGVSGSRTESYSYDLNGNRTGTGYHTTVMNEMTTAPGHTYTYDNAGNMISDNNGSSIATFTYDYRNRLVNVTTGGTIVATYTYDALDQRIGFKDSGTQTWTAYVGTSPNAHPYADFNVINGSGSLTTRYLYAPGIASGALVDQVLARTSSGGTTAWYLTDKLGSARDIVDTSGNSLDHVVYDSFGSVVTETNASNGDRFKFAGMEYDSTVGQYYDRARHYDQAIGRFMNQDPMGFAAGDTNTYRYVKNSVTNDTDSSGLLDWPDVVWPAVLKIDPRLVPPGQTWYVQPGAGGAPYEVSPRNWDGKPGQYKPVDGLWTPAGYLKIPTGTTVFVVGSLPDGRPIFTTNGRVWWYPVAYRNPQGDNPAAGEFNGYNWKKPYYRGDVLPKPRPLPPAPRPNVTPGSGAYTPYGGYNPGYAGGCQF